MDTDDESILGDWRLFRRIPFAQGGNCPHVVWNDNLKAWVPSSVAFNGYPDKPRVFSCHIESVLQDHGLGPELVIEDASRFALVAFTAGEARGAQQVIQRDPLPGDPAHAHVVGDKKKSLQKRLAKCAVWVIPPPFSGPPPPKSE